QLQRLGRAEGEGVPAGQLLGVGVAGQEALREAEHLDPLALGLLQALDHLGEVPLEIAALALQLAVSDAHAPPPDSFPRSTAPTGLPRKTPILPRRASVCQKPPVRRSVSP